MRAVGSMERLLDGVAVQWNPLGALLRPNRGKRLIKSQLEKRGSFAVYQNSLVPLGYYHEGNVPANTAFVIAAGAAGEIGYSEAPFWAADDVYFFPQSDLVDQKYIYHFLLTKRNEISSQVRRASIPRLSRSVIENLSIPIPCPEKPKKSLLIQSEIVRVLDTFSALAAELNAELAAELSAREKQYTYYRDQSLSFDDEDVQWKTLGEIARINTGQKPLEIIVTPTDFDYINAGTSRSGYSASTNCEGDTVTTPSRGQGGIGYVGYQKDPFWLGPLCYKIKSKDDALLVNKYLFYFLQSNTELLLSLKKEAGVPAINKSDVASIKIPVPLLGEQERIISILDKFEALTDSISESLPQEILLRQKQYEYYRHLLLSFPKPYEDAG